MRISTTDIKPLFEVSIYLLCGFSSFLLALAEGAILPAGFTLPLVLLAWYFNEHQQKWRLSLPWMNALGIAAFGVAALEFFSGNIEARLLAGAHLIVYIAWIVFFQDKRPRQFWWLCALGVLQVAVASVLTEQPVFGFLLVCYLFLAIWTLSIFSLYASQQLVRASGENGSHAPGRREDCGNAKAALTLSLSRAGSRVLQPEPISPFAILTGQPSRTYGTIQHDSRQARVGRRFVVGVLATAVLSLLVASFFFGAIPRLWITRWPAFRDAPEAGLVKPLTGFTADVQLGDIGEILESTEPVLEVRLLDVNTNEPLDIQEYAARWGYEEPLFRGAVLAGYHEGRWSSLDEDRSMEMPSRPIPKQVVVRQEMRLAPIGTDTLFVMQPAVACWLHHRNRKPYISMISSVLRRNDSVSKSRYLDYTAYSLKAPDPKNPIRLHEVPTEVAQRWRFRRLSAYLQVPDGLGRLKQLARQVVAAHLDPSDGGLGAARALESHLRDSGEYGYSLDLSIDDATIDPVEDFLFNRKQGHCEYFASALALMMRSVGIPARLVSGFKGGRLRAPDGMFVVEQRYAHAWVEAFIAGRWETFDATPGERALSVASMQASMSFWENLSHSVTNLWETTVVGISLQQQQRILFGPLREGIEVALQTVQNASEHAAEGAAGLRKAPIRWLLILVVAIPVVVITVLSGLDWFSRRVLHSNTRLPNPLIWLARLFSIRFGGSSARQTSCVEFYEQFQRIMSRYGFHRRPSQTPREFALEVQRDLERRPIEGDLRDFPGKLVERFYEIRFGAARLAPDETSRIVASLERLETYLQAPYPPSSSVTGVS